MSSCPAVSVANAYTHNHELLETSDLGLGETLFLHMVDTVGVLHAVILRMLSAPANSANVGLRGSLIPQDTWPLKACRAMDRNA